MSISRLLSCGIAAGLLAGVCAQAAPPIRDDRFDRVESAPLKQGLRAKLEAMEWYGSREALNLRFTLENPTSQSLWVLRWMLPSERMDAQLFAVTRDGEPVTYQGILVKRAPATPEDWVEIKPGESYTATFDPSADYDMAAKGQYGFEYQIRELAVRHRGPRGAMNPGLNPGLIKPIEGDAEPHGRAVVELVKAGLFYEGAPAEALGRAQEMTIIGGYNGCTTNQQGTLSTAHSNAITMAGKALVQLKTSNPYQFTWWFGPATTTAIKTVNTHFVAINDAFVNKTVTYDCSCRDNYYAYVYPTQPYKIYVCNAFWSAPATGRDSKAGTLIHEMSHFNAVAGTSDYVYGATGAHNLALRTPKKALNNADNHEYFAEDQK